MITFYLDNFYLFSFSKNIECSCLGAICHLIFVLFMWRWFLSFSYYYTIFYMLSLFSLALIPIILFLEYIEILFNFFMYVAFNIFYIYFLIIFIFILLVSVFLTGFLCVLDYNVYYYAAYIDNIKHKALKNLINKNNNKFALKFFLNNYFVHYNKFLGFIYLFLLLFILFNCVYHFKNILNLNFIYINAYFHSFLIPSVVCFFIFIILKLLINSIFLKQLLNNNIISFWNWNQTGEVVDLKLSDDVLVAYFQMFHTSNVELGESYLLVDHFGGKFVPSVIKHKTSSSYSGRRYRFLTHLEFMHFKSFIVDSYDDNIFYKFFGFWNYYIYKFFPFDYTNDFHIRGEDLIEYNLPCKI